MTVVSRLYDDYSDAARAVSELERAGIPHSDISIISNNESGWFDRNQDIGPGVPVRYATASLVHRLRRKVQAAW
jgi:hypothetical protein